MTRRPVPDTSGHRLDGAKSQIPELPCRRHDAELWFAEAPVDVQSAKSLCSSCPVKGPCLEGALQRREPCGVWGGELIVSGVIVVQKRRQRAAKPAA